MIKGSSKTIKKGTKTKEIIPKKKCFKCKSEKALINFYTSDKQEDEFGILDSCKVCVNPKDINDLNEVQIKLLAIDKPFIPDLWTKTIEQCRKNGKMNGIFGIYLKNLKTPNTTLNHLKSKDTKIITEKELTTPIKNETLTIIDTNEISKIDCIRLLGYEPFEGYLNLDQKILYNELINYLDEDTIEDQHKISVIIQMLNNNIQIRKIDSLINEFSSDSTKWKEHSTDIKNLQTQKNQLVSNNDKLAKENSIAIKHRGDKKAGQSTLGGMMKNLRELGFEKAEEDYFDMKKAYGMKVTAEISNKAILSQLNFDEKDIQDLFKDQRDLIIELQSKVEELEETLRITKIALKKSGDLK